MVDSILRSLRLGTSLTGALEDAASQSRATYRTALEERVAKAPVKMMLPTGTLILPAMLLMVMGPVLIELAGGFCWLARERNDAMGAWSRPLASVRQV